MIDNIRKSSISMLSMIYLPVLIVFLIVSLWMPQYTQASSLTESDDTTYSINNNTSTIDGSNISYEAEKNIYHASIIDDADLFSDNEETQILEALLPFTEFGNALAATSDVNDCSTVQQLAVKYYDRVFGTEPGAIFLIDMADREVYWYSEGDLYDKLSVKSAMAITDNVYNYATKGKFAECAAKAFEQAVTVINGGHIRQTMKHYGNALLALFIALFINYIFLRKTSFIRPGTDAPHELHEISKELLIGNAAHFTSITKKKQAYQTVNRRKFSGSGSSYGSGSYSSGSSSSSSRSSYSGSGSSSSSSSRSYSSSGSSSSRSGSSGSSSGSHRGGGAGHRF